MDLTQQIDTHLERLKWSQDQRRSHLIGTYGTANVKLLRNDQLQEFLNYLRAQPIMQVVIPVGLFDEIEKFLESKAKEADGEASRLLMALEDLEIERNFKELTKQE